MLTDVIAEATDDIFYAIVVNVYLYHKELNGNLVKTANISWILSETSSWTHSFPFWEVA